MRRSVSLFFVLFVLYCLQMGLLLLLCPWTGVWDRMSMSLPWERLRFTLLHPLTRSSLAAFGVLHLVWAAHDLQLWWSEGGGGDT